MIKKPPGIEDIFPDRIAKWNFIINTACGVFENYNYKEIKIPVIEYTEVFARGIGDETDIVSKEMFTFEDRGGRNLALRPEGTAPVVRAYVENGEYNRLSRCKLFYRGPMFRAERPQRGRLRQFNQFGAEFFGSGNPYYDFEIISITNTITERLGIKDYSILINSIGCPDCRHEYITLLKEYFSDKSSSLCKDCLRRLDTNPLRILDCKNEDCKSLRGGAPAISAHLCGRCREHYEQLKSYLEENKIVFTEDPYMVRGLDYYTRTTFEFVTDRLGGQNAFAAGGRYDNLVQVFNGKPTPAVGFAAGIERIALLIDDESIPESRPDLFVIHSGDRTLKMALQITDNLRKNNISVDIDPDNKSFKSQFKKADREKAKYSLIIGEEELDSNTCTLKNMETGSQERVNPEELVKFILS